MKTTEILDRLAADYRLRMNRAIRVGLPAFGALYVLLVVIQSHYLPLWFDEFFTYYVSGLKPQNLWLALTRGPELNPPLHYLAVRLATDLFGSNAFAVRLPSFLAFFAGCCFVFAFVLRRCRAEQAWAAALFPLAGIGFRYATEARPYAFLFAATASSLFFWQGATTSHRRTLTLFGLSASLAVGLLSHCYGVLLLIPLGIGESIRAFRSRHLDIPLCGAILAPLVCTISYIPAVRTSRALAEHTWATPTVSALLTSLTEALPFFWPILLFALIVAMDRAHNMGHHDSLSSGPPLPELWASVSAAGLPLVAFLIGRYATGFYTFRYALGCLAGLGSLIGFALHRTAAEPPWKRWAPAAALLVLWISNAAILTYGGSRDRTLLTQPVPSCVLRPSLPIVVPDGHLFLRLAHYWGDRAPVIFLYDVQFAIAYTNNTSVDMALQQLSTFVPLHIQPYRDFVQQHSRFLVYGPDTALSWVVPKLKSVGARFEQISDCEGAHSPTLYLVSMPDSPMSSSAVAPAPGQFRSGDLSKSAIGSKP